ncbi:Cof-type HAD-IIB family hydrolase [Halomonas koreensis]|uniref:Cof-type HAD-IIB family hydrolase n=1 Tax=Halomonas koreensis TaxID=245385 RepID=A0ABU1G3U7_9GAMM|nr:Cof-type HAD-IIB family hydrolase [Halomonas koreensis]MDR5867575.1 Cof-type HAD-IIB family hydrolase [Halomonas koreensis]
MGPHLIATDLDGTLLGADHALAEFTVATFQALAARGHHVALASGRHYHDILAFRDRLGIDAHVVSTNGAYTHGPDGKLLAARYLAGELARELIALPRPEGVRLNLYHDDEWVIDAEAPELLALHVHTGFGYRVVAPERLDGEGVGKVLYIGDPEALGELEAEIRRRAGAAAHVTYSTPNSLEIMAGGVNKGSALDALLARLELPAERCLAFGDNLNDTEMLTRAGEAHVMANAHPVLGEAVPHARRIGHHDQAAVARHLAERFGL